MKIIYSKTIVFITGCFVSHLCWNNWRTFFEEKGYLTIAPPWVNKNASAIELRSRHPDKKIASIRLTQIIDFYSKIIEKLPEKPILVGHSMGGLITQVLVNRNLAVAGVAIHSFPPHGIVPFEWAFYRSNWHSLGLFTLTSRSYLMSFKKWQYAFTNGLTLEEQKKTYEDNVIPESKMVCRDSLTGVAKVDFSKQHAPLLLISGSTDQCIPATLNLRNFKKYKENGSVLEYKEFPNRNHFVLGLPTWKEEAEYILNWLNIN